MIVNRSWDGRVEGQHVIGYEERLVHTGRQRRSNDNVEMLLVQVREYVRQYGSRTLKRCFVAKLECLEILLETAVGENGDLPENEGVRVNTFECILLLFPYLFLEGADIVVAWYLYSKEVARVVAEDQTVECECAVGQRWKGGWK